MYLNDHQRSEFYEALGLNTTQFNQHVIVETNRTTMRVFPACPDCESPEFWERMDRLVELNTQVLAIGKEDIPGALKTVKRAPLIERMLANIW